QRADRLSPSDPAMSGEPIADPPAGEARSRQLPGLAFAKRPVLFVDEDHVDHDVVRAYAELAGEFVGDLPVESKLQFFGVTDGAGHLDQDEVRRPIHVKEVPIIDEILWRVLIDNNEAVAIRSLKNTDNPFIHNVSEFGAIVCRFAFDQIDTCKRHNSLLCGRVDGFRLPSGW